MRASLLTAPFLALLWVFAASPIACAQDCDPLDVYIVMDKSGSISNADELCQTQTQTSCWKQISAWARSFYSELTTVTGGLYDGGTCDGLRIALVIYSNLGVVVLPTTGNAADIEDGFERLDTVGVTGGTDPAEAFQRIIELQDSDPLTNSRPQSIVYLTDGRNQANAALKKNNGDYQTTKCSACRAPIGTGSKRCIQMDFSDTCVLQATRKTDRTKQAVTTSTKLRTERETQLFGVGVGEEIDFKELEKITGSSDNVFTAKDTNSIKNIVAPLAARTLNLFEINFDSGVESQSYACASVPSEYSVRVTGKSVVHLEGRAMRCDFSGMDGVADAKIPAETTYKANGKDVEYLSCRVSGFPKSFWKWSSDFLVSLFIEADAGVGVEEKKISDFQVEIPVEWCFGAPSFNSASERQCFGGSTVASFSGPSVSRMEPLSKAWKCIFGDGAASYDAIPSFASGSVTCTDPYPANMDERPIAPTSLRVEGQLSNDPNGDTFTFFSTDALSGIRA